MTKVNGNSDKTISDYCDCTVTAMVMFPKSFNRDFFFVTVFYPLYERI